MSSSPRRPSISGSRAKIGRAFHHFDILKKAVEAFFANKPYSLVIEPDAERSRQIIRLRDTRQAPVGEWALIIGDCVHNLRSALDYIAWELAGSDPADNMTLFPICDNSKSFEEARKRRLKRVPEEPLALIEGLQPYHAADPHKNVLWAVQTLDATDKHKLLTLTVALPTGGAIMLPTRGGRYELKPFADAPFEDGAEVAHILMRPFRPEMDMNLRVTFDVAFDASLRMGSRQFVIDGLEFILRNVEDIVNLFDEWFFRP